MPKGWIKGRRRINKTEEERFWEKVDWEGKTKRECWPWVRGRTGNGYGAFSLDDRKQIGAHVYAFLWAYDYCPEEVCHTCDNPVCCNPSHLFAGTRLINATDKVSKDRQARGEDIGILSEFDIPVIRLRRAAGEYLCVIAGDYGVSISTISRIAKGHTWKHVQ